MSSSATFTIVESSTTMNWPRQTTASAIQRAGGVVEMAGPPQIVTVAKMIYMFMMIL